MEPWLIKMIITFIGYIIAQLGCYFRDITITIVGFIIMFMTMIIHCVL